MQKMPSKQSNFNKGRNKINERIKKRAKPRKLKYCSKHCEQWKAFMQRANYYIEQEIIEYCKTSNKENDTKNQENKQPT